MRKFAVVLGFLLLFPLLAHASMPKWDEDTSFLYGMQILDEEGGTLPPAPLDEGYLHDGLTIQVMNGMPYSDDFMLLFLLNGHLQPFHIGNDTFEYATYNLNSDSATELHVRFDELFVIDAEVQYLQIIVIGLLNRLTAHADDPIEGFSSMVTIPFRADSAVNTELPVLTEGTVLSDAVARRMEGVESVIIPYDQITQQRITYPPFMQEIRQSDFTFRVVAIGEAQLVQMIVIADHVPRANDDLSISCFDLEEGHAYEYSMRFENLDPGTHQFYAIYCPVLEPMGFSATTQKLRVDVQSD